MTSIQISGHPLEESITFKNVTTDTYIDNNHWLLSQEQAEQLVSAWATADRAGGCERCGESEDDLARAYRYSEIGIFFTALHMDHELTTDEWESAYGCGADARYSTSQMPFDFTITTQQ